MVLSAVFLASCSGSGANTSGVGSDNTVISGAVMISNTVSGAVPFKLFQLFKSSSSTCPASMQGATVDLYDVSHPEWLRPVATTMTNLNCGYTLNKLAHSNLNINPDGSLPYIDDTPIPAGKYTIVAYNNIINSGGKQFVAVQPFVRSFKGVISNNNLLAYDSEAVPKITSILGLKQNSDGTFGGSGVLVEKNRAIQVAFNMAMARLSMLDNISIKDNANTSVPGIWKVSPDLLSATFYPTLDLISGTVYVITVNNNVQNVYGKKIASTITGSFTATIADTTPPNAIYIGVSTGANINKPLKVASSELLDINTMFITSAPNIGDKPSVIFIGFDSALDSAIHKGYIYEILPSSALDLNTDYALKMGGARDMAGNPLTEVTINFKSELVPTPPSIESTYPVNNALGVPGNATLSVKFSSLMNPESIGPASVTLSNGTGFLSGKVSFNPTTRTMEFKPSANIPLDNLYTVTVKSGVSDLGDNTMGADYTWTFSTVVISAPVMVQLPKTGQTASYYSRDDGEFKKGVSSPNPRFTVGAGAESYCVTDNLTGLMWIRSFDSTQRTWQDALDYSNTLTFCGHSDWRLPNKNELRSLIDYSQNNPALPAGHPFTNVQSGYYWSSTTNPANTNAASFVNMSDGGLGDYPKEAYNFTWSVRAGDSGAQAVQLPQTGQVSCYDTLGNSIICGGTRQDGDLKKGVAWPDPRFTVGAGAENACVTDNMTGLMWVYAPDGATLTWPQAMDIVNGMTLCGHSDWRLPNLNELNSLINAKEPNTALWLNLQGFTNVQSYSYWSSTTIGNDTSYAWIVGMTSGYMFGNFKDNNTNCVWPVRGGQ